MSRLPLSYNNILYHTCLTTCPCPSNLKIYIDSFNSISVIFQFAGLDLQGNSQPSSAPSKYVPPHLRNRRNEPETLEQGKVIFYNSYIGTQWHRIYFFFIYLEYWLTL